MRYTAQPGIACRKGEHDGKRTYARSKFPLRKVEVATKEDLQIANNLLETLITHRKSCVGMAANMIGVRKRIIAFWDEIGRAPTYTVMLIRRLSSATAFKKPQEVVCRFSVTLVSARDVRLQERNV
ncbi:MAG: hypothetical protein ACI3X1_03210 [Eubacteriales bacterium]